MKPSEGDTERYERREERPGPEGGALAGAPLMRGLAAVADPARLASLRQTRLLDSAPEERFDRLAEQASDALGAPVALVSLVDSDRQFFKSCIGQLPEPWHSRRETPLSHSFCKHSVASGRPLIIEDAREDPVLGSSPGIEGLGIVAYAGVPLIDPHGHALGVLCVVDREPRQWSLEDINLLKRIAAAVVREVEVSRGNGHG